MEVPTFLELCNTPIDARYKDIMKTVNVTRLEDHVYDFFPYCGKDQNRYLQRSGECLATASQFSHCEQNCL